MKSWLINLDGEKLNLCLKNVRGLYHLQVSLTVNILNLVSSSLLIHLISLSAYFA